MNSHYWPEPPKDGSETYLVQHNNGEVHRLFLDSDGEWSGDRFWECSREALIRDGWLGVRTPFSEEAERAAFELCFKDADLRRHDPGGQYVNQLVSQTWVGWLERARR